MAKRNAVLAKTARKARTPTLPAKAIGAPAVTQAPVSGPVSSEWDEGAPLTERQHQFLERLLIDPTNLTRAYQSVYGCTYDAARSSAPALLANPRIAAALAHARSERRERAASDADKVIRELEHIASSDLTDIWEDTPPEQEGGKPGPIRLKPLCDWPLHARRAIAGMKIKRFPERRDPETGKVIEEAHEVMELKLWSKTEAAKLLGLHHGAKFNRAPVDGAGEVVKPEPQQFLIAGTVVVFS